MLSAPVNFRLPSMSCTRRQLSGALTGRTPAGSAWSSTSTAPSTIPTTGPRSSCSGASKRSTGATSAGCRAPARPQMRSSARSSNRDLSSLPGCASRRAKQRGYLTMSASTRRSSPRSCLASGSGVFSFLSSRTWTRIWTPSTSGCANISGTRYRCRRTPRRNCPRKWSTARQKIFKF